jgi:uncharacterized protein (TIGR00369 family)
MSGEASSVIASVRALLARGEPPFPLAGLVGFTVTAIQHGRVVVECDATERHTNPMGTVHGGVLCTLADTAMGLAHASILTSEESYATVDLKINFLKPVRREKVRAIGKVVKAGKTLVLLECDVFNARDELVARGLSTSMTLRSPTRLPPGRGTGG